MRSFFLLSFFVLITGLSFPKTNKASKFPPFPPEPSATETPRVFTFVEQNPEFPGGDGALIKFIQRNLKYPKLERKKNIEGKVLVRFIVNEDGQVSDAYVAKGVSPGLDKEAVRVVSMLPKFKAGKQQGKPIKVYFNIPIVFKLQ